MVALVQPDNRIAIDTVVHGDALAVLKTMADNSVDAIVTDPPYALTSGRLRVGYEHCLCYILLGIQFPNLDYSDTKRFKAFKFAPILSKASGLHSVNGSRIDARVNVPVRPVDFDNDTIAEHEINNESETPSTITEGILTGIGSMQGVQLGSDFILQLRRDTALSFCKGACSCYRRLGSGSIALNVVIPLAACSNGLLSTFFPGFTSGVTDNVGLGNNALRCSNSSANVVTSRTTELTAVLTLDMRNGTCELTPAISAGEAHFIIKPLSPEFIGTGTRAGSFTPPLETPNVSGVNGFTDRANTLNRLLMHPDIISFFSNYTTKGFMGKDWDNEEVAFSTDLWVEAMRVLRPGGHLLAFGGTRTYHRLASVIEDAGFECRDMLVWLYGSGFPKSKNLGDGRGTGLKPAQEPIILCRKPLAEPSIAANVLTYGVGGINVDACRVGNETRINRGMSSLGVMHDDNWQPKEVEHVASGRWPANLLLSHISLPVLGLTERIPLQIENDIRRYFDDYDRYVNLSAMRQRVPSTPLMVEERAQKVLQQGVLRGTSENTYRVEEPSLWDEAYRGSQAEDVPAQAQLRSTSPRASQLERRAVHSTWLSLGEYRDASTNRSDDGLSDASQNTSTRTWVHNGASSSDGSTPGASSQSDRVCTPHEREQTGQSDRESNDNGGCSTFQATQGDRAETGTSGRGKPPLIVLAHDVPHEWLQYFEVVGNLGCTPNGTKRVRANGGPPSPGLPKGGNTYSFGVSGNVTYRQDGMEEVEAWHCAEDCPIRLLDEQSGVRKSGAMKAEYRDSKGGLFGLPHGAPREPSEGGASRYFTNLPPDVPFLYTSKASRRERNAGCEGLPEQSPWTSFDGQYAKGRNPITGERSEHEYKREQSNHHPTVKPLALMRWLVRLVTPPDGIVLDPFAGSGSTLVACIQENKHFIGIEEKEEYVRIAEARIAHARREVL